MLSRKSMLSKTMSSQGCATSREAICGSVNVDEALRYKKLWKAACGGLSETRHGTSLIVFDADDITQLIVACPYLSLVDSFFFSFFLTSSSIIIFWGLMEKTVTCKGVNVALLSV